MDHKELDKKFIQSLSPHLFWDVDSNKLNVVKHKKLIIHRVLEYGLMSDWRVIYTYWGIDEIAAVASTLKDIEQKTVSFIALLSKTPVKKFACYNSPHLTPPHWNF